MESELQASGYNISILGINQPGNENGEALIASVSTLPVVQDDSVANVWPSWGATWRDVRILNKENELVYVYNLTQNNLAPGNGFCSDLAYFDQSTCQDAGFVWTSNYDFLKQLFMLASVQ